MSPATFADAPRVPAPPAPQHIAVDPGAERPARSELRRQIARLEKELGELLAGSFPRTGIEWGVGSLGGPRILGIAELERVRDALVYRLGEARAELARRAEVEHANRNLLERMIVDPERYPWVQISNADLGEPGCKHWHVWPRWGIVGLFMSWWRVKLSSGCPLATSIAA